jgi:hypothetical protein
MFKQKAMPREGWEFKREAFIEMKKKAGKNEIPPTQKLFRNEKSLLVTWN